MNRDEYIRFCNANEVRKQRHETVQALLTSGQSIEMLPALEKFKNTGDMSGFEEYQKYLNSSPSEKEKILEGMKKKRDELDEQIEKLKKQIDSREKDTTELEEKKKHYENYYREYENWAKNIYKEVVNETGPSHRVKIGELYNKLEEIKTKVKRGGWTQKYLYFLDVDDNKRYFVDSLVYDDGKIFFTISKDDNDFLPEQPPRCPYYWL